MRLKIEVSDVQPGEEEQAVYLLALMLWDLDCSRDVGTTELGQQQLTPEQHALLSQYTDDITSDNGAGGFSSYFGQKPLSLITDFGIVPKKEE